MEAYRLQHSVTLTALTELVVAGALPNLPEEPFGGDYRLDPKTGSVTSSTHPKRLKTFFKRKNPPAYLFPKIEPSYSFPRTWE